MSVLRSQHSPSSICPVIDHWESMALCWTEQWPSHLHAAYHYHHVVIPVSLNVFFLTIFIGLTPLGLRTISSLRLANQVHPVGIFSSNQNSFDFPAHHAFSVSPLPWNFLSACANLVVNTHLCLFRVKWVSFKGNLGYTHPVKIGPTRNHNVGIPFKYLSYP